MIQLTIAFFSWRKESFRLEVNIGYLRELPEGERRLLASARYKIVGGGMEF